MEAVRADEIPVLGAIPYLAREGMLSYAERSWRRHGDVFRAKPGPQECIFFSNPEAFRDVLKTRRGNYVKGEAYDGFRTLVGNGLVTAEGEEWQTNRRIAQPAFFPKTVEGFLPLFDDASRRLTGRFLDRPDRSVPVEINPEMTRVTLEIVAEALFGSHSDGSEGKDFSEALEFLSAAIDSVFTIPLWVPTPGNLKMQRTIKRLDRSVLSVVREARARVTANDRSVLRLFLDTRDEVTGTRFHDRQIRDEVITMFLAGHETTALVLTWGLHLLADHPEIVEKLRAEIDRELGDEPATIERLAKLRYTDAVIEELLRLRGPVWGVTRNAVADDELFGHRVRAKDTVFLLFFLAHRHPDFWRAPEEFRPERFESGHESKRHPFQYIPFSAGPRVCIGNGFSLLETKILLARLLREVDFEAVPGPQIAPLGQFTMRPSGPVRMRARPRRR